MDLRISEAIALQRKDLHLDGSEPPITIRRATVRGRTGRPKSRHGRRSIAFPHELVIKPRQHLAAQENKADDALVFASRNGTPLDTDNMRARMLKPVFEEIGASWASFHSLRHTYASLQLAAGVNIVQLSRAMGHHSAAFTLERYTHLIPGEAAPALNLGQQLAGVGTETTAAPAA